jgi:exodeoxyribonuclease VII small subunit
MLAPSRFERRSCAAFAAFVCGLKPLRDNRGAPTEDTPLTEPAADISKMPFEAALAELEGIVERLEKGNVALEESITLYERGEALKARCDFLLKEAEMRIEKITVGADGKAKGVTPLDEK